MNCMINKQNILIFFFCALFANKAFSNEYFFKVVWQNVGMDSEVQMLVQKPPSHPDQQQQNIFSSAVTLFLFFKLRVLNKSNRKIDSRSDVLSYHNSMQLSNVFAIVTFLFSVA